MLKIKNLCCEECDFDKFVLSRIHNDIIAFACNAKSFAIVILFAFAGNKKSFAIAILFFFLSLLPSAVFARIGKNFLSVFILSLPKTRVTNVGLFSQDTLANVFVLGLFTVFPGANDQFLFNMHVAFFECGQACLTS